MDYLYSIVDNLYFSDVNKNPINNGRRMASAVTVICCLHKLMPRGVTIDADHLSALLSMLRLIPDIQTRKCVDWEYLLNLIPANFKKVVSESILELTNKQSCMKYFSQLDWLYAIPVLHFVQEISQPFQDIELTPHAIKWQDNKINLGRVKSHTYSSDFGYVLQLLYTIASY